MCEPIPGSQFGPLDGGNFKHAWKGTYLQAHLLSDVGKKRKNNEDSCAMCVPKNAGLADKRGLLFAIADGMGGASAGEHASKMTLDIFTRSYFTDDCDTIPSCLERAIEKANEKVYAEALSNPEFAGMGTTISAITILDNWAYVAQVGDSRLYLLRHGLGIRQITRDHSLVEEQVRSGLISREEARTHSLKNLITRAVGIKETVEVDLFCLRIKNGDTLLLCSDGLSNMVSDERIADALGMQKLEVAAKKLIDRALDGGGTDNVTAVTVRVNDHPPKSDCHFGAEPVHLKPTGFLARLRTLFSS